MKTYKDYLDYMREIYDLKSTIILLERDESTIMNGGASDFRAGKIGLLRSIIKNKFLNKKFVILVNKLLKDRNTTEEKKTNLMATRLEIRNLKNYTDEFIHKLQQQISKSLGSWHRAKLEKNFEIFKEDLGNMIEIKKQEAEIIGYKIHPYDVLLGKFEYGMDVKKLDKIVEKIKKHIIPMVNKVKNKDVKKFDEKKFDSEKQKKILEIILDKMGFMSDGGYILYDCKHPFCKGINPKDVRIALRLDPKNIFTGIYAGLHEAGHGLYLQGLDHTKYGTYYCDFLSYGIHESQSILREKNIGKSKEFISGLGMLLKEKFPDELAQSDLDQIYNYINRIHKGPIRTNADELTYQLHIIIRYEIERDLISGKITINNVKEIWNKKYEEYLGIKIKNDAEGILQDIHWAVGFIGYFPTYLIGSIYATQFYNSAKKGIKLLEEQILEWDFKAIKHWLKENIYCVGKTCSSEELCKKVTKEKINVQYFIDYLRKKYK